MCYNYLKNDLYSNPLLILCKPTSSLYFDLVSKSLVESSKNSDYLSVYSFGFHIYKTIIYANTDNFSYLITITTFFIVLARIYSTTLNRSCILVCFSSSKASKGKLHYFPLRIVFTDPSTQRP